MPPTLVLLPMAMVFPGGMTGIKARSLAPGVAPELQFAVLNQFESWPPTVAVGNQVSVVAPKADKNEPESRALLAARPSTFFVERFIGIFSRPSGLNTNQSIEQ